MFDKKQIIGYDVQVTLKVTININTEMLSYVMIL